MNKDAHRVAEWDVQPGEPDAAECAEFYRGRVGQQAARKKKGTQLVQLWYWGNGGHWGPLRPLPWNERFFHKPTIGQWHPSDDNSGGVK